MSRQPSNPLTLHSSLPAFYAGKRVFITGHTGFKGGWLSLWLQAMGAEVHGYALNPPTEPNLFTVADVGKRMASSVIADIRDADNLRKAMQAACPEIVFHLAAQPLVRYSYTQPVETYAVNVMGTVHLLEAVRATPGVKAVVNVTTDKCYENREWVWGYRETEPMGGFDPYSSSKGCSELVTAAYRNSFFHKNNYEVHGVAVASARAGNVIGGGDWATDRLIPDCIAALLKCEPVKIRNPKSIRPWQYVIEPLSGYILLAQKLYEGGPEYASSWNFGPNDEDARPVELIVGKICSAWSTDASYEIQNGEQLHEAHYLKLDCSKARGILGWKPKWNLDQAIEAIIAWTHAYKEQQEMRSVCLKQIEEYSQ